MKTIIKADVQAVTDTGLPFTLHRTDAGTWEAKITVKTSTGAPLTYFYSASTLEGLQTFIDGVEHTTQTIEQENTEEQPEDVSPFDSPLSFTLYHTCEGTWEVDITVKTSIGAPLIYSYSAPTLEGLPAFIDGVERTTQAIEQENTNEEDDDEELFDDPLEPHYIRG